jgi:hypothetical protein
VVPVEVGLEQPAGLLQAGGRWRQVAVHPNRHLDVDDVLRRKPGTEVEPM